MRSRVTERKLVRDYVAVAIAFAKKAIADKKNKVHGVMIRQAAQRFMKDLERVKTEECKFIFDDWHACDPCDFIEKMPHVEGVWDTPNIELHPAQVFFIVQLFGFRLKSNGHRRYTSALYATARKSGKALALDTVLPTPSGWSNIGDIKTGDFVLGADGLPTKVLWTSEVYNHHDCYELEFSNGEKVVADAGHLWLTEARCDISDRNRVRTTQEIFNTLMDKRKTHFNHSIKMSLPQAFNTKDLSIDMYSFGMSICNDVDDRSIPINYLRSSFNNRLSLLQGLMDTFGFFDGKNNCLRFVTKKHNLKNSFCELLSTFGINYGNNESISFIVFTHEIPVFKNENKKNKYLENKLINSFHRVEIVGAKKVDSVPVKCLAVDNADKLFLFGRTMLPTHNSTVAAGILIYCLCCEEEPGAQVISAATTFPQASIIFNVAKRMVEKTSDLREAFGLDVWAKSITRFETGSSLKAIHAKASTQDGLNPSHVGLDEIHAHKTADLLNVLLSAAGARANPLWLYTTTEGYTNPGPWADIRKFAKDLLKGIFGDDADHFLAIFFAIDDKDDEFDESCWVKANPLIDVNPHLLSAIRKEAVEAKSMPSKMAEFKIKRLNRPASTSEGYIDLAKWQMCDGKVDLKWLEDYECFGGLDLASTMDLTSFRLVWNIEGRIYTAGYRWVPESAVAQRTERGTVPYAGWVSAGLIKQTPGNTTDYDIVRQDVLDLNERFKIKNIAFDRWNAAQLVNQLVDAGLPMIEFVQGSKSYHPAMQALEVAYVGGKINHGGDPVLNWCASNLVHRTDQNLNLSPDKKRSADKIDDMTALLMGVGLSVAAEPEEPEFQMIVL